MALSVPPTKCPCNDLQVTVNAPPVQLCSGTHAVHSPRAWGRHLTRGITIANHHKPLSPFAVILAPVPRNPHSGFEAPRGPHPGTGHRNRTIFSPGQAEALEKGAGTGVDTGSEVLGVMHAGNDPEACGPGLRGGGYGWPCLREEGS